MTASETAHDQLGVIAREEQACADAIRSALASAGVDVTGWRIDVRPLPFAGTWGSASTVCRMVAGALVSAELEASGALEGLSKKEAKQLVNDRVGDRAQALAEEVAAAMRASGRFASVEAVNGYINTSYNAEAMARTLVHEVIDQGVAYGHAPEGSRQRRVMIEHSQLNTHKAAHVGHLRNICLGVALTNISTAGGFTTIPVTYIGDIGRHVVKTLWCYRAFHQGQEPATGVSRGRWLGELYAESSNRLAYRDDVLGFLNSVIKEDAAFGESIDRQLHLLWQAGTPVDGEDIASILGKVSTKGELTAEEFLDANVIALWWPFVGEQLADELASATEAEDEAAVSSASARLNRWTELNAHIDWWGQVPQWIMDERATFNLWETKDPEFVKLWETTRQWSMDELRAIFDEFGATFDIWYTESEVEDDGRAIVRELLQMGIAEMSDGLPVVKIDEKLGLETETYRTLPILRSDGSTLYSTKDLALAKKKFSEQHIDSSIWVVDVRQSLYFDQITQILKLYGFDQADANIHESYEFVQLPTGVMSSRSGKAPLLEDVRGTMLERAAAVIREKNGDLPEALQRQIAQDVAIGSIKYVMLARDGNKVITFDPDEALSFDGHAAPYIQYAHARACRILEHAGLTEADVRASIDTVRLSDPAPEELGLLQQISAFPETVQRAADERRPLHVTNYVYELAKRFNDFYHACPVLQSEGDLRAMRLALVTLTRITLRNGLALLGINAPSTM